ncbi:DUF4245 family protein [Microbacterium sp. YY-01]|uniref:DUF4245 family protein n=1 Tax=Microbacterium sp. YY-01 TaxID=3421634 RepID=UPI003D1675FD
MTDSRQRVVAELGRPETPEETAARKAESSRIYRSSQTMRNLITALGVTLAVVAIIIFAVPRGEPLEPQPIDIETVAHDAQVSLDRPLVVPEAPDAWRITQAHVAGGPVKTWNMTLAPMGKEDRGFLRVTQAVEADRLWAATPLRGTQAVGTTSIAGIEWDEYRPANPEAVGNISYALGTQIGDDYLLVYGALSADKTADFVTTLAPAINQILESE